MRSDLLEELFDKEPRETAGGPTAARFDYQKDWAFCEMLRRHMQNADYLVAFEFHDDVVFLQPSTNPTGADLYQVKTTASSAPRKLASLTQRPKGKNSILGKMCLNTRGICASHNLRLILVSNVAFEFGDGEVSALDIEEKYRKKILTKLADEISGFTESDFSKLHFLVSGVAVEKMQSYLQGEAMELFKASFGEDHGLNVHSWIRLVQGEIRRKNNYNGPEIASVDDLVAKKCLSRSFIEESLVTVAKSKKSLPDMNLLSGELREAGWTTQELLRLNRFLPQAMSDMMDATNTECVALISTIQQVIANRPMPEWQLPSLVAAVQSQRAGTLNKFDPYSDRAALASLVVLVYNETV